MNDPFHLTLSVRWRHASRRVAARPMIGAVGSFSLEIVEGPGAGRTVPVGGELTIGRSSAAGLELDDARVAARHARVLQVGADLAIEDLGSSNGTFVNGMPLDGLTWLHPGDELLLGVTVLRLRGDAAPAAPGTRSYRRPPQEERAARPPARDPREPGRFKLTGLLDVNVKRRARSAPPALLALVLAIVSLYLLMR